MRTHPPGIEALTVPICTRSNHEKNVAILLKGEGYEPYLPFILCDRHANNRTVASEFLLFPGYLFCRFEATNRLPILMTTDVISVRRGHGAFESSRCARLTCS
ncbi:MAG: hypothetical protein JOZ32_12305 [Bryobacterales bacterium]|nr:hypothetical protein [Bryobacterales bacterium]